MTIAGFVLACMRRLGNGRGRSLVIVLAAALVLPAAASATMLPPWGSSLAATPNYDTANGDYTPSGGPGFTSSNPTRGARSALLNPGNPGDTSYHGGDDAAVWNTAVADTAPAGGQVLQIKVKGCAWNDPVTPGYPNNELSAGIPVNQVNFQTLSRQSDGSYVPAATAAGFHFPFCSDSSNPSDARAAVNTNTVTTYQPIHMCVNKGDVIGFADIGGYVPETGSYANGLPFLVIAGNGSAASGSVMNSYVHVNGGAYAPSSANFASESGEELMLQVIEGVGDDAYGLCPGGKANEPGNANTVICVYHQTSPSDPYGTCNAQNQPVYAPTNSALPGISGTPAVGQRLNESHGTWTNSPFGYKFQWERCDLSGANCNAIAGATNGYYYPVSSDLGDTLRVQEWAINDASTQGPAASAPTGVVTGGGGSAGGSGDGGGGVGSSSGAVNLRLLRLNPASFFAAKGTTVTYTDSRPARTTLHVFRLAPGRRRGPACVALPRRKPKQFVKCTRVVAATTFAHQDKAGGNGVKLSGLAPGKYELEAIARMGQGSSFAIAHFTVKPSGFIARKHR